MPHVDINYAMLAPLIAMVVGALAVLAIDLILPLGRSRPWAFLAAIGGVLVSAWYVYGQGAAPASAAGQGPATVLGAYVGDGFTLLFQTLILAAAGLGILLSVSWQEMRLEPDLRQDSSGYLSLLLLAAAGMMTMVAAGDLITLFVGLELLSLSLYVLVGFSRESRAAREGAFKYFVLGSVASGFLLYGFAMIFGETGSVVLADIAGAGIGAEGALLGGRAKMGVGLAIVGFAFKLALVPFHAWAPDAYQGAPTPVTAFMAVGTKVAAFAALYRFLGAAIPADLLGPVIVPLAVLAVLSMAVGSLGAMAQEDFKRLLAYSAIAHAGYLVLALSHRSEEAVTAGFFYLAAYAFTSLGAFAVLLWVTRGRRAGGDLASLTGLYYRAPWPALALTLFLLSMAGMPPTGGFVGKLLLVLAAIRSGAWFLIMGLIVTTGLSAYVYLRVIRTMFDRTAWAESLEAEPAFVEAAVGVERPEGTEGAEGAAAVGEGAQTETPAVTPAVEAETGAVEGGSASSAAKATWPWHLAASVAVVIVICVVGTLQLGLIPNWVLGSARGLASATGLLPLF